MICADVALTAFVNTAAETGLSVTFEVYNSENKNLTEKKGKKPS